MFNVASASPMQPPENWNRRNKLSSPPQKPRNPPATTPPFFWPSPPPSPTPPIGRCRCSTPTLRAPRVARNKAAFNYFEGTCSSPKRKIRTPPSRLSSLLPRGQETWHGASDHCQPNGRNRLTRAFPAPKWKKPNPSRSLCFPIWSLLSVPNKVGSPA